MYREAFEELKVLKSEVEYLTKLTEQSRAKLVMEYDSWYKVRAADLLYFRGCVCTMQ